jgi:Siphovirus protein of unknown function (DUF859)
LVLTVTEGPKNVATQKVRIDYVLQIAKGVNRTTWHGGVIPDQSWSITLGGVTVASGTHIAFNFDTVPNAGVAPGTLFDIHSGSEEFSYGADGTLDLSVAFAADVNVWSGGSYGVGSVIMSTATYPSSGTVNFTPQPINVATQPEVIPKSANVGATVTVNLPRVVNTFTHDVTWASGSLSGSIGTGLGTSTTWTVPDVTAEFPTQVQSPITITAVTKDGVTTIGSRSTTLMVWNSAPTLDPTSAQPYDIRVRRVQWDGSRLRANNPLVTLSMKVTDTASSTPTIELETSGVVPGSDDDLEGALVALEVQNGLQWQATGLMFVLSREQGDDVAVVETNKWSGIGYLDYLLARAYRTIDWKRTGSGTNAGNMMRYLVSDAKTRGWGPNIDTSFPEHFTTVGDGWLQSGTTREISGGSPLSQILDAFVNDGWAEYRSRYDDSDGICYLDMTNPLTGSDWTASDSQVTVNLATAKIESAPSTWSFDGVLDRVYAIGDANTGNSSTSTDNQGAPLGSAERPAYNQEEFGVLEGWASASGQTALAGVQEVARNALDNATETKSRQFTYKAAAVSRNLLPYYTFKPHDWILVPSDRDHSADPISMRVSQVVLDKGSSGLSVTVICGDLIPAGATAAIAKRIKAGTGNRISGGTLRDPIPLQSLIPAAPNFAAEEAAVSTGYWTTAGEPRSTVTFGWEPVTTALDGVTPLTVDYYEVWWRPNAGVPWALRTFSTDTDVEMNDWEVGFTAQFRVRGRSTAGAFGEFSAYDEVTTVAPTASIAALAVGALYTDGLGNIFADWDGYLGDTSLVPSYFAYMSAEISPDVAGSPSGVWTVIGNPLQAAGTVTLNPQSFGTWWVRFRAYDRLGGPGVNGTPDSITTVNPGLVAPPTPQAPTGFAATAGATWDALGVNTGDYSALSWTAVTQDIDTDPVTISYYEVDGDDGSGDWVNVLRITGIEHDLPVFRGSSWTYRVRAISNQGGVSAWSSSVGPVVANATLAPLTAPSVPGVTSSKGLLYVNWNGLDNTASAYTIGSGFRYAYVEVAPDVTGAPGTWVRAGTAFPGRAGTSIVSGLAAAGAYYARIVVVDGTGDEVAGLESEVITLLGVQGSDIDPATIIGSNLDPGFADGATITGATFQTDAAADTGVKVTSGGVVAYDSAGDPTFILDASSGSVWFGAGTISGAAIDVSTIDVGLLQASLITNGMGDALTIGGTSLVSIISGIQADVSEQGTNLATYFDFGAAGQWKSDSDAAVAGLRISSTSDADAFNTFSFSGGFQIRRGSTALSWWEADPSSPSVVRFVTPNATVLNDLNVGSHTMRPGAAGVTIISAQ